VCLLVGLVPLLALGEPRAVPKTSASAAPSTSASASASARPKSKASPGATGFLPDPPVTSATRTYRYPVQVTDGTVSVGKPRLVTHTNPVVTPRTMGRFALELYVGRELLERVRFDLPLLDAPSPPRSPNAPPDFARHANVRVHVEVPLLDRATYAIWVDRATGATKRIFWPPVDDFVPVPKGSASAPSATTGSATPAPSSARGTPEPP
jgi:hypothetical protein